MGKESSGGCGKMGGEGRSLEEDSSEDSRGKGKVKM